MEPLHRYKRQTWQKRLIRPTAPGAKNEVNILENMACVSECQDSDSLIGDSGEELRVRNASKPLAGRSTAQKFFRAGKEVLEKKFNEENFDAMCK